MNISVVNPITNESVTRKSSIYQHKDLLSVMEKGEWCPLVFDYIDKVDCDGVHSHKVAIRLRDGLNYTFPVGTCRYTSDVYFLTQKDKKELAVLPEWFGTGFYETHVRQNMLTNIGKDAFGNRQEKILRVGQDYCMATKTLKAVE